MVKRLVRKKIAVDFGSQNLRVWSLGGAKIDSPSVIAFSRDQNSIVSVGKEAYEMIGKTPEVLEASFPVIGGAIKDLSEARALLGYHLESILGRFEIVKPHIMASVPIDATSVERKAMLDLLLSAGAGHGYVLESPLAAALGSGIPVASPSGHLCALIGYQTSQAAVISLGGIVVSSGIRIGSKSIDDKISEHIKDKYGLLIGEQSAEKIKMDYLSLEPSRQRQITVVGRDVVYGIPQNISISAEELHEATNSSISELIEPVRDVLSKIPPELASDIIDNGMIIAGGGAKIAGIEKLAASMTSIPAVVADEPEYAVVRGLGVVLENIDLWKRSVTQIR